MLVRGAAFLLPVSIHAPTRGATLPVVLLLSPYTWFQSTLPRGERLRQF